MNCRRIAPLLACALLNAQSPEAKATPEFRGRLVDSVLEWLPANTESLVVGEAPFTIAKHEVGEVLSAEERARGHLLGLLAAAEKATLFDKLAGQTVKQAVLGARSFDIWGQRKPPPGYGTGPPLGLIPYQGCAFYAFSEPLVEPILTRPPEERISRRSVYISKGSQGDWPDTDLYYLTLLQRDLLVVCNNRGLLVETLVCVGLPGKRSALPAELPEWGHIDRTCPVWGLSHFRGQSVPMETLWQLGGSESAIGITVMFGPGRYAAKSRALAQSDPFKALLDHPDFQGAAQARDVAKGVWELSVNGNPHAAGFAVFVLMASLGFIILI